MSISVLIGMDSEGEICSVVVVNEDQVSDAMRALRDAQPTPEEGFPLDYSAHAPDSLNEAITQACPPPTPLQRMCADLDNLMERFEDRLIAMEAEPERAHDDMGDIEMARVVIYKIDCIERASGPSDHMDEIRRRIMHATGGNLEVD